MKKAIRAAAVAGNVATTVRSELTPQQVSRRHLATLPLLATSATGDSTGRLSVLARRACRALRVRPSRRQDACCTDAGLTIEVPIGTAQSDDVGFTYVLSKSPALLLRASHLRVRTVHPTRKR